MDKIFQNKAYKILELFMEHSLKHYHIREIARKLNLNHATVAKYVQQLCKLKLIRKELSTLYPTYYANREDKIFRFYKKQYMLYKIRKSGLVKYIEKKSWPNCMVLYGSCGDGYYTERSDIDIFVEAKDIDLDLYQFEKKLGKKIHVLFEPNINDLSRELRINIVLGTLLYGHINVM